VNGTFRSNLLGQMSIRGEAVSCNGSITGLGIPVEPLRVSRESLESVHIRVWTLSENVDKK